MAELGRNGREVLRIVLGRWTTESHAKWEPKKGAVTGIGMLGNKYTHTRKFLYQVM